MNKLFATAALVVGLVAAGSSAYAKDCWISARTHERVCMTTSDGAGSPYKPAVKPKAVQAMEIAHARQKRAEARAKRRPWR
jgi:hypothetical protein